MTNKKKTALIVVNAYARKDTRQVRRIAEELNARGVEVKAERNGFFPFRTGADKTEVPLYDFCVYLDKDKYAARILEERGMRLFDSADAISVCDDKMLTHIALDGQVPMPQTVPGLLCYDESEKVNSAYLDAIERALGYPLIVKQSYGSQGKGVYKADDRETLDILADRFKLQPHLFQQFIKNSYGRDMRVIVVGGEVVGGIMRTSASDFRSNIGLGGTASACDVPTDIKDIALKTAGLLGLDYCGIDFLLSPDPLVCEVNSNAFFDAFEAATGINVAGKYAEHIIKCVYGKI